VVEIANTGPAEDDGVEFRTDTATSSTIRDGDLYGGVRVAMDALLAGARIKLRLDISTGDPVVPPPDLITYPTLRAQDRDLRVLGYPLPVVLAEKLCTAVSLGVGNSRIRDYADVWTLTGLQDFAEQRSASYSAYLRRLGPDASGLPADFVAVVQGVVDFADPVLAGALPAEGIWRCSDRRWGV
jgi:hypothetical protein